MASIRNPDEFIREYVQLGQPVPFPILLLTAIAFAIKPVAIFMAYSGTIDNTDVIRNGTIAQFGVQFLTAFLLWLLLAGAFFIIAKVLGGRPSMGRLLRSVPWGFMFLVPAGLLWSAGIYLGLDDRMSELFPGGEENLFDIDPFLNPGMQVQFEHIEALRSAAKETSIYTSMQWVGILFVVFASVFWYFAVKHSTQLDRAGAAVTTAIPTLTYIVWLLGLI